MKRKLMDECDYPKASSRYPDVSITATSFKVVKGHRIGAKRVPSAIRDAHVCTQIDSAICKRIEHLFHEDELLDVDVQVGSGAVRFLFFLGAQGKEFIEYIRSKFPEGFNSLAFVSSNLEQSPYYKQMDMPLYLSSSRACVELSSYFGINDPLGGGSYPLNFLIIVDGHHRLRCQLPIRIGRGYQSHEKFGISLDQLSGLVDEVLGYFGTF